MRSSIHKHYYFGGKKHMSNLIHFQDVMTHLFFLKKIALRRESVKFEQSKMKYIGNYTKKIIDLHAERPKTINKISILYKLHVFML